MKRSCNESVLCRKLQFHSKSYVLQDTLRIVACRLRAGNRPSAIKTRCCLYRQALLLTQQNAAKLTVHIRSNMDAFWIILAMANTLGWQGLAKRTASASFARLKTRSLQLSLRRVADWYFDSVPKPLNLNYINLHTDYTCPDSLQCFSGSLKSAPSTRSTAPGELGQTWGALGQPMMGALWRNRQGVLLQRLPAGFLRQEALP